VCLVVSLKKIIYILQMKKNIISIQEIERNNRVKELMSNRVERKKQQPLKLTQEEMFEVKAFMKEGISRSEAVNLVLEKNKLLNVKTNERTHLNNWNTGGFITDTKYKQPIKHRK
jgi:uncharacterized protein YoaH (UPF0181 family)